MIEALPSALRGLDEDAQALLDVLLTAIVLTALRAQAALDVEIVGGELPR